MPIIEKNDKCEVKVFDPPACHHLRFFSRGIREDQRDLNPEFLIAIMRTPSK
jgi:hypothetical protein